MDLLIFEASDAALNGLKGTSPFPISKTMIKLDVDRRI